MRGVPATEEVSTTRFTLSLLLMADWMTVVVPFTAGSTRSFWLSSTLVSTVELHWRIAKIACL